MSLVWHNGVFQNKCVGEVKIGAMKKRETNIDLSLPAEVNDLLDKLVSTYDKPEDILGETGLIKRLTKAVLERSLQGEMMHHLGYEHGEAGKRVDENARNGSKPKTVKSSAGEMTIAVPRDRNATRENGQCRSKIGSKLFSNLPFFTRIESHSVNPSSVYKPILKHSLDQTTTSSFVFCFSCCRISICHDRSLI